MSCAPKGGKTDEEKTACRPWVQTLLDYLADGKVANVLERLRKLTAVPEAANDTLHKGIDYFVTHHRAHGGALDQADHEGRGRLGPAMEGAVRHTGRAGTPENLRGEDVLQNRLV